MSKYIAMNKDVLLEIFLRMSVQSLLRLRAVCKSWWVGSVKDLICINHKNFEVPIAIKGQLKILPLTTTSISSSEILDRSVAIGFIDEDYKVAQLLLCKKHRRLHAELYSEIVPTAVPMWRTGFVFLEHERGYWSPWSSYASTGPDFRGAFVYDYCARKFICRYILPPQSMIVEYRGSFVSLLN
ncbi:hypothetical protein AAHA92_25786 [Salvia divinorum]|uniref:F-box domain-containing protein n=1 Tax=Salvia divinorum TaxID=28513 RepID=A0ABD1GEE2_SALDI